jgi:hypothetical protein
VLHGYVDQRNNMHSMVRAVVSSWTTAVAPPLPLWRRMRAADRSIVSRESADPVRGKFSGSCRGLDPERP